MAGVVAAGVALVVALAATPVAAAVARRLGVLDHPGELKVHARPVPYLGGAAVFAAAVAGFAVGGWDDPEWLLPLLLALALGVADDVRHVPPRLRLAVEVVIGVVAAVVAPAPGPLGAVVSAGLVVVLVNAVNLLDGLDGLATGVTLMSTLAFVAVGGDGRELALALAGALAGFLVFNRPPARIYLGDGGAYLIGTALAVLGARALHEGEGGGWFALPLVVAVPVVDTAIAILRRWRAGRPLSEGDRSHLYDQLVDRGRSVVVTLLCCAGGQAALGAVGAAVWTAPPAVAAGVAAAVALLLAAAAVRLGVLDPQVAP